MLTGKNSISHIFSQTGMPSGMKTGLFLISVLLIWSCSLNKLPAQKITEEFTTNLDEHISGSIGLVAGCFLSVIDGPVSDDFYSI